MGTQATQPSGSSAAAAAYPHRWMLLAPYSECDDEGSCVTGGDPATVAAARHSSGHLVSVSLRRAPPPLLSHLCVHGVGVPTFRYARGTRTAYATAVAAHGDSILMEITVLDHGGRDYFVYNLGSADDPTNILPSLSLLPPRNVVRRRGVRDVSSTGLLRRGTADGEVVVAELVIVEDNDSTTTPVKQGAVLLLFRSGEWCVKWPRIFIRDDGTDWEALLSSWRTGTVVPLGDGLLCWVDFYRGLLLSDVFSETPTLRYVPYPVEAVPPYWYSRESFLCISPPLGALNLVNIKAHRCSHCGCSEHAHDIHTWMLKADDVASACWVLSTTVDSTELWTLHSGVGGYTRVQLVYPVVSMSNGGHVIPDKRAAPIEEDDDDDIAEIAGPRPSKIARLIQYVTGWVTS